MKSFRNSFRLRTRALGLRETSLLSNRQPSATAPCKAHISSLLPVPSASIVVRCQALTMPKWMRPFLKGQPGNQILSAILVMEIRANFTPEHRALNLLRHAKSSNLRNHPPRDWLQGSGISGRLRGFEFFLSSFPNVGRDDTIPVEGSAQGI